ncbi:translocation/assembly module TamB [Chitinophagaceae bacterium LB-8]|uniref:Translocation/assembly module TamB n=1 Tax=Paraflavisolibacter caeni TaxID=2982496 RepID=A0A9X3B724_9BACT|nr:hypothetical protein [Paraflavisolibacter caeni]MCU7548031.1 translocation/assembly module TamB [Paraflavisolibacter caeni]
MVQKWIKRAVIFFAIIIFLIAGFLLFLHTPIGKSIVRQKVESYLQQKWMTGVNIGSIDYRLPNWIVLEQVLILDRKRDTLLSGGRLYAGIKPLKLLSNTVDITGVSLEEITLHLGREAGDTAFNFQFILDAFTPSSKPKTAPSKSTPMQLSANKLFLDNVRFSLNDKKGKFYLSAVIGSFSCTPDELNLEKTTFRVNQLLLMNSQVSIIDSFSSGNSKPVTTSSSRADPAALVVAINKLGLQNIRFSYHGPCDKTGIDILVDSLQFKDGFLDLASQTIKGRHISINKSTVELLSCIPARKVASEKEQKQSPTKNYYWDIHVDTITLNNNSFAYHNSAVPAKGGLDWQHLNLQRISLVITHGDLDSSRLLTNLDVRSLLMNDQLNFKKMTAQVRLTKSLLSVSDLSAAINQSQLSTRGNLILPYGPGSYQAANPPKVRIKNSTINYGDLLLIQPGLKKILPVSLLPSENIMVSANVSGDLFNFKAEEVRLTTSSKQVQFNGSIDLNIRGSTAPVYKATIDQLHLKKQILSKDLLDQIEKANTRLPGDVAMAGQIQGTGKKLTADLRLNSTLGQLNVKGTAQNISDPNQLDYDFQLDANQFETGKLLGLDSILGKTTGHVLIKGRGIQMGQLAATVVLQLASATIQGYSYSNINLEGGISKSVFTARGRIDDPNLETEIDLQGHISNRGTAVQGNILIGRADLNKIHLTGDSIIVASNINIDADYASPQRINASIRADSNRITVRGKEVFADSISFICKSDPDSTLLLANAPFINATLRCNYPVNMLSSEISSLLKAVYLVKDQAHVDLGLPGMRNRRTSVDVKLTQDELLSSLVPELTFNEPVMINGTYDAGKKDSFLFIKMSAPSIQYDNYVGNDLQFKAESSDSAIQFVLSGREILGGAKPLASPNITGELRKDKLDVKGKVEDTTGKEYYSGSVGVTFEKNRTIFRLSDDLNLNYSKWKVPIDNSVTVQKDGFIVDNLSLENKGQILYINSKDRQTISPIDIRIDSFDIGNILAIASYGDTMIAKGTLKADINIQQPINKVPVLTGDIIAKNLAVYNIPVGDLNFHSNTSGDSLVMNGSISGNNQLDFSGSIHPVHERINVHTRLQKLDINLAQEFTKEWLTRVSGQISGELQLAGSPDSLSGQGVISLDSVTFALKDFNALYRIDKQKIYIEYPAINFRKFIISDTLGHPLTVQGQVKIISIGKVGMDLSLETKKLVVLNAVRQAESHIYGTGILDAQVAIKGTSEEPVINGNAYLHEKSSVHFLLSPKSNSIKRQKGGIVFVDIDTLSLPGADIEAPVKDSITARKEFKGLKYNLDLKVSKDAVFSVIIDPSTNDELLVKGEGRLNAGLGESGQMGINGVYHLQSGYYKMNNLLLKGKFMLVAGSTITFDGDPMSAVADVTTEYEVETSAKGLLDYKDIDDEAYSQKATFVVVFMIKGPVSKPVLSFDIKLKQGKNSLNSSVRSDIEHELDRLRNDVSAMNKQVFSLLLTKRFSSAEGSNTVASSNLNVNNALKEGVSSFLAEAMNQVADQLIKGVDIDVNMTSYKSGDDPISKTDLGVAMSKDLFQNRMVISVEENFLLNDDGSSAQKSGSQYVPDITTTYKLSKDGHLQVKAYQKNEFDAVVQGYFTEVGVSFTFELSYDHLKELLHRKKYLPNEEK